MIEILCKLPERLIPWYSANRRDLPWRKDREPYHIWISEIMLQQTRVEAVKAYYNRFLQQIPSIQMLATVEDEILLKLWEGLGYYSRARNMKKAAGIIMRQYGGVFPQEYDSVLALPGIGSYTAGAILSICFNQKTPAVDGNVLHRTHPKDHHCLPFHARLRSDRYASDAACRGRGGNGIDRGRGCALCETAHGGSERH